MSPREYRLYHFTSFETLKLILAEDGGFWPRYCPEDFSWAVGKPHYLMVPLVSFCDIPIILSKEHREVYGDIAIGLSKDWGKEHGLAPLLYVDQDGPLAQHIKNSISSALLKTPIEPAGCGKLWPLVHYLKPLGGFFPNREKHGTEYKDFDEELEWRYVPSEFKETIYSADLFESYDKEHANLLSQRTFDQKLKFHSENIEIVAVEDEVQRVSLLDQFSYLNGKVSLWSELQILDSD